MNRVVFAVAGFAAAFAVSGAALAAQPITNYQPSLVLNEVIPSAGLFPSQGGGNAAGDTLGFVYDLASPVSSIYGGTISAQGQLLPINSNTATFSLLGVNYGGNGFSNFGVPNLTGRAVIGAGGSYSPGQTVGSSTVTLGAAQNPRGADPQPFDNQQPSLVLTPMIAVSGVFPSQGGGNPSAAFIGEIAYFAGPPGYIPAGWLPADGRTLAIQNNTALFSLLGTTYGGNGFSTFALPDLTGRVAVGVSAAHPTGSVYGEAQTTLTTAQLPKGATPGQPVNDDQPSLALNYLIAVQGVFPSQSGSLNENEPVLGQIVAFAGPTNYIPSGWLPADGQLLAIQNNTALFSLLGTTYGGNGFSTFALPDLDGRTIIGSGADFDVGEEIGQDQFILTGADNPFPAPSSVPEPATWAMLLLGMGLLGAVLRRKAEVATAA